MRLFRRRKAAPECAPGGHRIPAGDLDDLRNDPKFPIETVCEGCGRYVRISADRDRPMEYYWVTAV